jgi:hypothetical protein
MTIPTPPHAGECTRTCAHTRAHESARAHTPKEDQEAAHHTIHCGNQPASIRRRSLSTQGHKSATRAQISQSGGYSAGMTPCVREVVAAPCWHCRCRDRAHKRPRRALSVKARPGRGLTVEEAQRDDGRGGRRLHEVHVHLDLHDRTQPPRPGWQTPGGNADRYVQARPRRNRKPRCSGYSRVHKGTIAD